MSFIGVAIPAFLISISVIIRLRPDEQMVRIHAQRNVTSMTDDHPFWDSAVRFRPNGAVHQDMFVGDNHLWIAATIYLTIP